MKTHLLRNRVRKAVGARSGRTKERIDGPGERPVDPISPLAEGRRSRPWIWLAADASTVHRNSRQTHSGQGEEEEQGE